MMQGYETEVRRRGMRQEYDKVVRLTGTKQGYDAWYMGMRQGYDTGVPYRSYPVHAVTGVHTPVSYHRV